MDRGRARLGWISRRAGNSPGDMSGDVPYSPVPSFGTWPGASALRESGAFSLSASMVGDGGRWRQTSKQVREAELQQEEGRKRET